MTFNRDIVLYESYCFDFSVLIANIQTCYKREVDDLRDSYTQINADYVECCGKKSLKYIDVFDVRENRMGYQEQTIQRHRQNIEQQTHNEENKTTKHNTEETNITTDIRMIRFSEFTIAIGGKANITTYIRMIRLSEFTTAIGGKAKCSQKAMIRQRLCYSVNLTKRFICDREKSKSMQDEKYTFTI